MDLEGRLLGRCVADAVKNGSKTILKAGAIIDEKAIQIIRDEQVAEVAVRSVMFCQTEGGVCKKCYGYDLGKKEEVKTGTPVGIIAAQSIGEPGTQLTMRTFHMGGVASEEASITQGLSRVEELFEARSPSSPAVVAEIAGKAKVKKGKNDTKIMISAKGAEEDVHHIGINFEPDVKKGDTIREKQIIARSTETKSTIKSRCAGNVVEVSKDHITIHQDEAQEKVYIIPPRMTLRVKDNQEVKKGDPLTIGHLDPRVLMELTSVEKVQEYILADVLNIYASQGQQINEKHIEVIVKQMVSKVRILEPGDSGWLSGEVKNYVSFEKMNAYLKKKKKKIVVGERLLLGLTRISLWTESWLSAASFQETIRVLVDAAVSRRIDTLDGLKENVIIGRLIPAGEGYEAALAQKALSGFKTEEIYEQSS